MSIASETFVVRRNIIEYYAGDIRVDAIQYLANPYSSLHVREVITGNQDDRISKTCQRKTVTDNEQRRRIDKNVIELLFPTLYERLEATRGQGFRRKRDLLAGSKEVKVGQARVVA